MINQIIKTALQFIYCLCFSLELNLCCMFVRLKDVQFEEGVMYWKVYGIMIYIQSYPQHICIDLHFV